MPAGAAAQAKAIGFKPAIGDVEEAAYGGLVLRGDTAPITIDFDCWLSVAELDVEHGCSCGEIEREAMKTSIEEAVLVGVNGR